MSTRYAIYFSPAQHSPWWNFGSHWLGRNEWDDTLLQQPQLENMSANELAAITKEPRRYGFHATLKAPFRLPTGYTRADLLTRIESLAATLAPVALGTLRVSTIGNFFALVPEGAADALQWFAATCVTRLDDLRAPLNAADIQRRSVAHLDTREAELLQQFGYPYVMERFRFHFTLTGPVDSSMQERILVAANPWVNQLNKEAFLWLDRLCLFVQESPEAAFRRVADVQVGA
jgi:putative phosphonate metabolism protein